MNNKYINSETFEIVENPNFFEVDEYIAKTISILNKKGYLTLYSCSGHNNKSCYKVSTDIDLLEEAKNKFNTYIGEIGKHTFDYFSESEITNVYIKFKKHYDFPFLPNGFDYETAEKAKESYENLELQSNTDITFGDYISKIIHFFKNNNRLDDEYIENEIKSANKILYDWAEKLPKNKT